MTGDPLTVLKEFEAVYCRDAAYPECMPLHAALDDVEALVSALERAYDHGNLDGDLLDAYIAYQRRSDRG